jgi:heterodisulfide reductase subunit C
MTLVSPLAGPRTPGVLPKTERELRDAFLAEVARIPGGSRVNHCIQCGTCTASCPVSSAMDLMPREVIAMFRAGAMEEILHSRTIWVCASCYQCTQRCPADIQVTALMYALKRIAIERGMFPKRFPVHVMSETFTNEVKKYGRNHETGLLLRYFLRTKPLGLLRRSGSGLAMLRKGRLRLRPSRIKDTEGLRKIIARAERVDEPQERYDREPVTATVGYDAIGR